MKENKLEKKLSPFHVWALAFGCIIGWGAFVMPGNKFLPSGGILGTLIGIMIAAVLMIMISFNYSYMIGKYPISGGEFIFSEQAFGKAHGFLCGWFLALSYATLVPMNATALALIGRTLLQDYFQFGFHYQIYGYDIYFGEILLAMAAIIVIGMISIKGVKIASTFQLCLTTMLITGILAIGLSAVYKHKLSIDQLMPAFYPAEKPLHGVIAVLAVMPFAFVGFDTVPQAAEEYGFSDNKTRKIMIISIIFGASVYSLLNLIAASAHEGYENWAKYIEELPRLDGLASIPTFHAAYALLGSWGLLFIGIAVLGAILSGITGFYMATSRLLYSMSRRSVIPKWFGYLDPKYKTPRNAICFIMLVSLPAPFLGRVVLGWLVDMSSLGAAIGYGYTSAATLKYAIRERKKLGIMTGIAGVISALVFAVILLVPIRNLKCSLGVQSYVCLILWTILGILFKFLSNRRRENDQTGNNE